MFHRILEFIQGFLRGPQSNGRKGRGLSGAALPGVLCTAAGFLFIVSMVLILPDNSDAAGVTGSSGKGRDNRLHFDESFSPESGDPALDSKGGRGADVSGAAAGDTDGAVTHLDRADCPEDWNLYIVNPWNSLPEDYEVSLKAIEKGHFVDERCYDDLKVMLEDCRAEGLSPYICSSYRTQEYQEGLFQQNVDKLMAQGYSEADAQAETATCIAVPGTSEHQLGLAVDIVDIHDQNLDKSQEDTAVQKWLMENCWRYGFILRYPTDKSDVTGIIYEPWHYRYVGKDAAKEIYEQGVCLEEYLEGLK